jgi:hypothetical protein
MTHNISIHSLAVKPARRFFIRLVVPLAVKNHFLTDNSWVVKSIRPLYGGPVHLLFGGNHFLTDTFFQAVKLTRQLFGGYTRLVVPLAVKNHFLTESSLDTAEALLEMTINNSPGIQ